MGSTPAKAILNEVTGTNRSLLRGYGEVAGHKADVIVANPNGITVNGGGFINTPRAILTTGSPRFHEGILNGFDVKKGDILIEGDGFNASNIDKVDLYTKALQLNASLYAKTLDVVTGVNSIDLDGAIAPDDTLGTEAFSIDSSALGGIYADIIRLSATQRGVGVNLPPIAYASNSLELRADGKIILSNIVADRTIDINSQNSDIVLTKDITANDVSLFAKKEILIPTDHVVKALNNLSMNAQELLTNDGEINALLGVGTTFIQSANLFNNGLIGGYDVNVQSAVTDNAGAIYSKNNLSLSGKTLDNNGVIRSNNDIELLVEESLTNHKEGIIQSDGSMLISAHAKTNTLNNLGVIQSGDAMTIVAKELNNIADAPTINTVTSATTSKISQGGSNSYDIVTVTTTTDVITIQPTPAQILSQGDMSIDVEKLNNSYSLIASDNDMFLNADEAKNIGSVLVETTVTTTVKYRDERYCSTRKLGACLNHKHRAAYRGTFSQTATKRTPLSNAGIQAKKSISGNVLTLSNLTDQLSGVMDAQQIVANLATIDVLESSSYELQESLSALQNSSDALVLNGEDDGIETIIADALNKSDMPSFSSNLLSLTTQLKQDISDTKTAIASLESTTASIKAKNYNTSSLELATAQLKNNLLLSEGHLSDIETLQASLTNTSDLSLHKQELLSSDQAIKALLLENSQLLGTLDIMPVANALEADADTLRTTVNSALELQTNVEYKVITQESGLYQTNTHHALTPSTALSYSNSTDATIDGITLPQRKYGLFLANKDLSHRYLIERNSLYTDYDTFISSDYLLDKLGFDPDRFMKRLGDGAYETKLVRESVMRLSGSRYLNGYNSDNEQYLALMDNAIRIQSSLGLVVGVALSKEQIAALDDDIVWLQEIEIDGIKVLAPRVYLVARDTTAGPNITADTISLNINSALTNDGVIHANSTLSLKADTITNTNGTFASGGEMTLEAKSNLTNTSGTIVSGGDMALYSGGTITNDIASKQMEYRYAQGYQTSTQTGKASNIISGGNLLMEADGDINLMGSSIKADKDAILLSGGDINAKAFESRDAYDFRLRNGYTKGNSSTYNASSITADNLFLGASNINITSSSLNADAALELMARENINILSGHNLIFTDTKLKSSSGFFGSKVTQDTSLKESVISSTLRGNSVSMLSAKDINLQAANLKATETIKVDALGDINVIAKEYLEAEMHYTKKSGFLGLSSSLSIDQSDALKLHEATLKTEAKNIIMNSGKDINIVASEVNSAADVALRAFENLNIIAGQEVESQKHIREKSSFNLANLATGFATLGLVDTGAVYSNEIHNKDAFDTTAKSSSITAKGDITADTGTTNITGSHLSAGGDITLKADIGGVNISSAVELRNASTLDKKTEIKLSNIITSATKAVEGLSDDTRLKFNIATAEFDESTTTAQSVTNVASSLTSGKNITIDSSDDIAIKGSDVTAKNTIDMKSTTGNISITESIDTTNTNAKEKHASADINLVVQNEYVQTAVAVDEALKAAEQLKQTKEDYGSYRREVKKLEATLEALKTDAQVSENDIANLQGLLAVTKDDEAYYLAAIAAATLNLASKTVAIAQQTEAAGASTATLGFSAGVSLDLQGSKSTTDTTTTKSNASNLTASNISIATDTTADTSVTISGSNLNATDMLNIDTHNLNVIASTDTTSANSNSKDISGSLSMTVYGAASGPQVSLGYGKNESQSTSTTHTNSTLTANTMNIDASNDANFKGATVRANETLNLSVGNNLTVASLQDTSSSSSHGFNIGGGFELGNDSAYSSNNPDDAARKVEQGKLNQRVGIRTGDGTVASVNGGIGASNGRSFDTQTVLTSLTGDSVNITTGANTKLSGAVIAATEKVNGEAREATLGYANGNDTGKLNLTTDTLTTENLTDTHYNSNTGFSIAANVGLNQDTKDPKPNTQDKEDKTTTTINSPRLSFNTSTDTSVGKTLATVGGGNLNITDTANSSNTANLNRDVSKVDKELYSSNTGTKVDATLDTRLLSENGQQEIKQQYNDMDENMKAVSDTLPNATSDNPVEAAAGTVWNNLTGFTGGILPSHANNGGVLGEIPILSGDKDSVHKILQVVNTNAPLYQEEKENFIPLEQSDAYKMMSEEKQVLYKDKGLYISKEPVTITKDNATYQNGGNGIMNNEGLALHNVMEQTGMLNQLASSPNTPVEATVFYNPTRGMVADLLESAVDTMGGTTGIAKQAGEFTRDVTTARGANGSNFTDHSQKNILTYSGINYINSSDNTGARFMPQEYFIKDNGDDSGIPTFVSFGSPVSGKEMETLITNTGFTYMGAYTKPNDGVGEILGSNNGANEGSVSSLYRFNPAVILYDSVLLFTPWSPHGGYNPTDYEKLKDVTGYKK